MEQERRRAIVFLILGISFNSIGITQQATGVKTTFHLLGIVFLVIAIVRFVRIKKEKNKEGQ